MKQTLLLIIRHPLITLEAMYFLIQARSECRRSTPCETAQRNYVVPLPPTINDAKKTLLSINRILSALVRRGPIVFSCLQQSIALCRMLKRRNLPYSLKIGIKKNLDKTQLAHAWVESLGVTISWGVSLKDYEELMPTAQNLSQSRV